MIELHIPLEEDSVYNILSDGWHEITYQVGSCFEWEYPEPEGFSVAKFSFRTEYQGIETVRMLKGLLASIAPSKAYLVLHGYRRGVAFS